MPADKHQIERCKILDRLFSDFHHKYTYEEIFKILKTEMKENFNISVSDRTLRNDLAYIRNFLNGDPELIAYPGIGKARYYRYNKRGKGMFSTELTHEECSVLEQAIKALSKYRGLAGYNWLDTALLNMELKFGMRPSNRSNEAVISFDHNEKAGSNKWLTKAIDATTYKTPLNIIYRPFDKPEKKWTIHPWYLKQYNNRWFLFGFVDEEEMLVNVALDRIFDIKEANVTFKRNKDINFEKYFKDVIGVTVPKSNNVPQEIKLRFSPHRYPYVMSKPLHWTQIPIEGEEYTITINVIINRELESQLLYFGKDVEVISPPELREKIKKNLEDAVKNY